MSRSSFLVYQDIVRIAYAMELATGQQVSYYERPSFPGIWVIYVHSGMPVVHFYYYKGVLFRDFKWFSSRPTRIS